MQRHAVHHAEVAGDAQAAFQRGVPQVLVAVDLNIHQIGVVDDGLHAGAIGQVGKKQRQHHEDDTDDFVLLPQVGHSALTDVRGNFAHALRTLVLALHQAVKRPGESQGDDRRGRYDPKNRRNVHIIHKS